MSDTRFVISLDDIVFPEGVTPTICFSSDVLEVYAGDVLMKRVVNPEAQQRIDEYARSVQEKEELYRKTMASCNCTCRDCECACHENDEGWD